MAEKNVLSRIPTQQMPERQGNFLSRMADEAIGAFERYGRRSGAQRDASLALLNQAVDPNTDPLTGAGQKLLGLAGLITHPLAFFPTGDEWRERLANAGNTSRLGQSVGGMLGDLPGLIDPQLLAGGGVLAAAPLVGKLNKWNTPQVRDVTDKFDTTVYHATGREFEDFDPSQSHRGASFFAGNPERAKKGASAGQGDGTGSGSSRLMAAKVPSEEIMGLSYTPAEKKWFDGLPDVVAEGDLDNLMKSAPKAKGKSGEYNFSNINKWYNVFSEVQNPDGSFSYVKIKDAWKKPYDKAAADNLDVYGKQFAHWGPQTSESDVAASALANEMSGYTVQDEAGLTVAMANPNRIWLRSVGQ